MGRSKNEINKREHNLSFEAAQYVFLDPERIERLDQSEGNTSSEERLQTIGMVGKILFVVYTERERISGLFQRVRQTNQKGEVIMAIIKSTLKVGQKPPKEVIKRVKKAAKKSIVYTDEFPPSSPEALKEFAHLAAERNRRKKKQSITIRVNQDVLESYKTMGSGYTGIMADVLKYAVNNPAVLAEAAR